MPLRNYGVVKGHPLAHDRETDDDTPHYQIHLDAGGTSFRLPATSNPASSRRSWCISRRRRSAIP